MKTQEFEIEAMKGTKFRTKYISPVDLLALGSQVDLDDFYKSQLLFTFALEHIEVLIGDNNKWFTVKTPGQEVYMPLGIEENLKALNQLSAWFIENIVIKTFTNSSE